MAKITIGITTYGPIPRAQQLVRTILATVDPDISYEIAIADDSLGGKFDNMDRRSFCKRYGITLLEGNTITGIPASWNRLIAFAKRQESKIIIIFSDGIRLLVPGWLSRMVHFLENNEKIGMVGTPTVGEPTFDSSESRWDGTPARVGAAVGSSFALKTEVADLVHNPDGTIGFYGDLLSFHEEIDFGFSLAEQGYLSAMLPWPPSYYRGGMAFGTHEELTWRKSSSYLPIDIFIKYARMSKWYVPQYEESYQESNVDKMSYSRIMVCKKWGILEEIEAGRRYQNIKGEMVDILSDPPKFYHPKVVDIWPPRTVRWLDRHGVERTIDSF